MSLGNEFEYTSGDYLVQFGPRGKRKKKEKGKPKNNIQNDS